ncbi:4Fe-4S ferredoxin-type, iron-sulphur binding domain protein [Acididesulfobacillus acetoxydans]|uniref:4Fe-4S ferredoxin-type, iron-sulphur binding domain protein n=1 Tax=Acididesulfobacillus acetoxydans TaxID=1561005 RepID=A0A8S0WIF5_9FIRM|nr:4Fe-4S dicluster domain-containing protein [Acididesulfobacillus acetoxydans]CAA7603302.1 4Fe-4S ferredoxin-type, iron-sulphur binding domain protein [Acididesulfobacillus acetoxydans]
MTDTNTLSKIQEKARRLLEDGKVEVVIGFAAGTVPGKSTPSFISAKEDCESLVWDNGCSLNLAKYVLKEKRKAAIIVKGCDSRSLVNLITENQIKRENLYIIGAACPLSASCAGCQVKVPVIYDELIEDGSEIREVSTIAERRYDDVLEFEKLSAEERKAYVYGEVSKCIRCYACRNVCPACYCKECFAEKSLPQWIGKTTDIGDNLIFHLIRALHVAGRCVDCGSCQRACPMGVNLRLLNHKLLMEVGSLYQFEAGLKEDQILPLNTYQYDDPQPFLAKGGGHE